MNHGAVAAAVLESQSEGFSLPLGTFFKCCATSRLPGAMDSLPSTSSPTCAGIVFPSRFVRQLRAQHTIFFFLESGFLGDAFACRP